MEEYVSEIIGEEYREWKPGNLVFLSAHTGAGKTYFILHDLLEFVALEGKRILFLVNRSILKEQIEEKIRTEIGNKLRKNKNIEKINMVNAIDVELYQTIENACKRNSEYKNQIRYDYIIADESHYFLEDSTFNPYTQLSYNWVMQRKDEAVLVFISATIDRIKQYIMKDNGIENVDDSNEVKKGIRVVRGAERFAKNYCMKADYSYVDVSLLCKSEELVEFVERDGGKWLIFVDSVEKGRKIESLLKEKEISAFFITANSKREEELSGMVQEIRTREKYEQTVLIATSVLDNGISIKDFELRNLVIMAVTKEQFIQMIGRKRKASSAEKLKVYLLLREQKDFQRFLTECEKRLRFISEFQKDNIQRDNHRLLQKILASGAYYQCAKNICFVEQGSLVFSELAIAQFDYLYEYYKRLVEKFEEEGSTAFLREQLSWLGRENLEEEVRRLTKTLSDNICEIIEKYKDRDLNSNENKEMFGKVRVYICQALESGVGCEGVDQGEIKKIISGLKKNDRTFSESNFNQVMELLNLNYQMTKPTGKVFIISNKDLKEKSEKDKENNETLSGK